MEPGGGHHVGRVRSRDTNLGELQADQILDPGPEIRLVALRLSRRGRSAARCAGRPRACPPAWRRRRAPPRRGGWASERALSHGLLRRARPGPRPRRRPPPRRHEEAPAARARPDRSFSEANLAVLQPGGICRRQYDPKAAVAVRLASRSGRLRSGRESRRGRQCGSGAEG